MYEITYPGYTRDFLIHIGRKRMHDIHEQLLENIDNQIQLMTDMYYYNQLDTKNAICDMFTLIELNSLLCQKESNILRAIFTIESMGP